MKMKYAYFAVGMVILFLAGVIVLMLPTIKEGHRPIACTMEAKLCPDGSAVGRTGPNCEFAECPEVADDRSNLIRVSAPISGAMVSSPLRIKGEARGYWYFEASFPVRIYDANNMLLGTAIAQAQGDWMTEDFVPFDDTLIFQRPTTETGTIVFEKDNPSGLPENEDMIRIPVRFDTSEKSIRTVSLYYYNPEKDRDEHGNIVCSRKGLVAVSRTIPVSKTPLQDTLDLLFRGDLTPEERAQGIVTEFPLQGLDLEYVSNRDGVVTLTFSDPYNKTSDGSCRVGILWFGIEATAKQFFPTNSIIFSPTELFQP